MQNLTNKDFLAEGEDSFLSLVKMTGSSIKDVWGHPGPEGTFDLCLIFFQDGTQLIVGAHLDSAYAFAGYDKIPKNMDKGTLERLYKEGLENEGLEDL